MRCLLLINIVLILFLAACNSGTAITATTTNPPPTLVLPTSTIIPTVTATAAPSTTFTVPKTTDTPDVCAGATDPGARQKFTFDQIVPCLNNPDKVSEFMMNNISLDGNYDAKACGENCYYPAPIVYQNGVDDSDGQAILQCYFIEKNGWDASMLGLSVDTPFGHNICGVNSDGAILVMDDVGQIVGPFQTLKGIADYYVNKNEMTEGGTIRSIKASQITKVTTDQTSPSVLQLPWKILKY